MNTAAETPLDTAEVTQLSSEAVNPDSTPDFVPLTGTDGTMYQVPIKFMPIKKERSIVKLLAPMLPKFLEVSKNFEELASVAEEAMDILPTVVAIICEKVPGLENVTKDWIEENCSSVQLYAVAEAQLKKYGKQDALGKLFGTSARLNMTTDTPVT